MSARRAWAAVASLGVTAGSLLLASPAFADGLPLPPLTISKTTVAVNEPFTISGTGCISPVSGSLPDYLRAGDVLVLGPSSATVHADSAGNWSTTMKFPAAPGGTFAIKAVCDYQTGAGLAQQTYPSPARLTVLGGPTPTKASVSPRTDVPTPRPVPTQAAPPGTTVAPPPPPTPSGPAPATPASGCIACARIASGAPLGAGWPVSLRYTGFQPNEQVTLVMHSTPLWLGSFTADASGVVTASVRIPQEAVAGAHTFVFTGQASGERDVSLRVTAAAPVVRERPAPDSGTPIVVAAVGAAVGLALAAGVVLVYRRRRHDGQAAAAAS